MCKLRFSVLVLACAAVTPLFGQSTFQMTDLGTLPGSTSSTATAINDSGQVVGYSGNHAFFWDNGVMTDLGTLPGDTSSTATAINNSGQVVGSSGKHGFLWDNSVMIDLGQLLPDPDGFGTGATAINDSGQVVGYSGKHAFLWQDGVMSDLGTLGTNECNRSVATAINNNGQVAGSSSEVNSPFCAYLHNISPVVWNNGVMTALPFSVPRGLVTPTGINDVGQVAGYSQDDFGPVGGWIWDNGVAYRIYLAPSFARAINQSGQVVGSRNPVGAFFWDQGVTTDIGSLPGQSGSSANGINDCGQVVGQSGSHAFLWQDGVMSDLGTLPDATFSRASRINNQGQVIGQSGTAVYEHAFLLETQTSKLSHP